MTKRTAKRKSSKIIIGIVLLLILAVVFVPMLMNQSNSKKLDVAAYNQHPDYPTGCESASLYMLLNYYNINASMEEIVEGLPKGPTPYEKDGGVYGANPEKEFVGDPKDSNSYGVFNEPIKEVADTFKSGAIAKTGATIDDVKAIIDSGNPVIAWNTTNLEKVIEYREEWLDYETGEIIKWPSYEHAVLVYGYDTNNIFYNDPNTGSSCSLRNGDFLNAFDKLGGRIVYYND